MFTAYATAFQQRFAAQITREQGIAAGTLDDATKAALAKLDTIRPAHAGKVGAGAWRDYLYKPALEGAPRPMGTNQLLPDARDQWANEITSFEEEWLGFVERAKPEATEPHAYTIWWDVAGPRFRDATGPLANTIPEQAAINARLVERLGATRPAGTFDEDGATFQAQITQAIAMDYTSVAPSPAKWQGALGLMPDGGGPLSYKTWATAFAGIAVDFNASTRNDAQRGLFALIVAARPGASGADVDEIVRRLTTGLASAGNDPSGTPLATVSIPVVCP